jgi:hypothetical protein
LEHVSKLIKVKFITLQTKISTLPSFSKNQLSSSNVESDQTVLPMHISTTLKKFPFETVLSLRPLVEYWEKSISENGLTFLRGLRDLIAEAPELKQPVADRSILKKHADLIRYMMSAAIPSSETEYDLITATAPFNFESFYSTAAFEKNISLRDFDRVAKVNIPGHDMVVGKTIHACLLILNKFYNVSIPFDKPILFTVPNHQTGLDKVYKLEISRQFFEIVQKKKDLRPIDPKVIKFLIEKVYDVDLWLRYIKPEDFAFEGFMVLRMIDVTEQEMLSSIKYDLLEKNAVTRKETFGSIQHKLRSIFNMPDIRLGLAFFDSNNNIVLSSTEDEALWKSLAGDTDNCSFEGSLYERSWSEKRYVTVEDLKNYPYKSRLEEMLLDNGVRSILLAPLVDEGETIGMLEVATAEPGKLNAISASKIEHVIPMFTSAVKRVKEEMATEIRAIIQEECTNIHPSVQWRFIQAGANVLSKRRHGEHATMEEIVFKDVHPMFGLADVRNSSTERNAAIQQDLQQNLKLVKDLLQRIYSTRKLPLLEELIFKTESQLTNIIDGLASGDENNVLEFLKSEINPLLDHFKDEEDIQKLIRRYQHHLDPVFGVVYKRRKAFEESLGMINKMIGATLDEAQRVAQQMFPHYFEKYQTDGIEYTLYLGSSLVQDRKFDAFYLKNFRLWQLMLMCDIDKKMDQLKPKLKNKLDITQLILVHDHPLSIRFRPDEKQFDVDGAYDIRYEIVKKRIDKAYIKNSGERLTQPGKIAIVYNQGLPMNTRDILNTCRLKI